MQERAEATAYPMRRARTVSLYGMTPVKVADARAQIGSCVSAIIAAAFEDEAAEARLDKHTYLPWPGSSNPGHDPLHAPPVPATVVDTRPTFTGDSASVFTWKAETREPPYMSLLVGPTWLSRVVRAGFAVLGGYPVLEILATSPDDDGRPVQVKAVSLHTCFDGSLHGWRAWSSDVTCAVDWSGAEPALTVQQD
jgi:hypothetical protein